MRGETHMMFRNDIYKELKIGTIENSIAISKANICSEALKEKIGEKSLRYIEDNSDNKKYGLDLLNAMAIYFL